MKTKNKLKMIPPDEMKEIARQILNDDGR